MLTWFTVIVILFAIPLTVVVLRTGQTQTIRASGSVNFNAPPDLSMQVRDSVEGIPNKKIITVNTGSSNWYSVYFAEQPININSFNSKRQIADAISFENIQSVYEYTGSGEFEYTFTKPGTLFAISYQLTNYAGDFEAGDVACDWNGELYIYERDRPNIIFETLNINTENPGFWKSFARCQNSGPITVAY